MREFNQISADQYEMINNGMGCLSKCIKKPKNHQLKTYGYFHYDKFILKVIRIKKNEMDQIKEYVYKNGSINVDYYIREAIREYLENHECSI